MLDHTDATRRDATLTAVGFDLDAIGGASWHQVHGNSKLPAVGTFSIILVAQGVT